MNGSEAKKVELTDDRLEQVSGGSHYVPQTPGMGTFYCSKCGCAFKSAEKLVKHEKQCTGSVVSD